jgi:hypothetical protein
VNHSQECVKHIKSLEVTEATEATETTTAKKNKKMQTSKTEPAKTTNSKRTKSQRTKKKPTKAKKPRGRRQKIPPLVKACQGNPRHVITQQNASQTLCSLQTDPSSSGRTLSTLPERLLG